MINAVRKFKILCTFDGLQILNTTKNSFVHSYRTNKSGGKKLSRRTFSQLYRFTLENWKTIFISFPAHVKEITPLAGWSYSVTNLHQNLVIH